MTRVLKTLVDMIINVIYKQCDLAVRWFRVRAVGRVGRSWL